jgi:hypothetical protein
MVDLPTPDGPDMTMSVPLREVLKEGLALVASKAPDCTVVGDADVFEQSLCAHFAHVRHGDNNGLDLRSCHEVIFFRPLEDVREADTPRLEKLFDFGTRSARLPGAVERGRSLLFCHFWEHAASFAWHRIKLSESFC